MSMLSVSTLSMRHLCARALPVGLFAFITITAACVDNGPPQATGPLDQDSGTGDDTGGGDTGPTGPPEKVNVTNETLDVEGRQRGYTLALPKTLDAQKEYPLVLVFHGDGGDGPGMRTYYKLDAASGDDAIVAYPSGTDNGWDIYTPLADNADMKFIAALVTSLTAKYKVDATHIFAAGYSSGGFFINQYACRHTGFFRAIVSFAGGAPDEPNDPEATKWPSGATKCKDQSGGVAAMIVHGDADGTVEPASGDYNAQYWAGINGCQDTRSDSPPPPCKKHDGCPDDKPVLYCLIPKLGHGVWDQGTTAGWAFMKQF